MGEHVATRRWDGISCWDHDRDYKLLHVSGSQPLNSSWKVAKTWIEPSFSAFTACFSHFEAFLFALFITLIQSEMFSLSDPIQLYLKELKLNEQKEAAVFKRGSVCVCWGLLISHAPPHSTHTSFLKTNVQGRDEFSHLLFRQCRLDSVSFKLKAQIQNLQRRWRSAVHFSEFSSTQCDVN